MKYCPFCGSRKLLVDTAVTGGRRIYWVCCKDCDTQGPTGHSEKEAISLWKVRR